MSGKVGVSSIYHTRLPHQWKLERMLAEPLSDAARTRLKWITHYKKKGSAALTCRHYDLNRSTFYKWLARFTQRGLAGLEDLPRAPRRSRTSSVPWQTVQLIVDLRKEWPAWSKHKIAVILARDHAITLSASTVGRIMKRKGLYDVKVSRKRSKAGKRARQRIRAEWWMKNAFPGCLVQVDTKHLRFGGQKYYQFTAIDCFSRIAYCRVFKSIRSTAARRFLEEVAEFMPFPLVALQTDNGSEFLSRFDQATEERFLTHYFSHPHCPKENAHVERKIQTTKYELWAFKDGYSALSLNEVVDEWNHVYNHVRPHQSLSYLTPMEFLEKWNEESKNRDPVSAM